MGRDGVYLLCRPNRDTRVQQHRAHTTHPQPAYGAERQSIYPQHATPVRDDRRTRRLRTKTGQRKRRGTHSADPHHTTHTHWRRSSRRLYQQQEHADTTVSTLLLRLLQQSRTVQPRHARHQRTLQPLVSYHLPPTMQLASHTRKPTPQLLSLADNSQNEDKKALFISEIPYWGTEKEKRGVERYLASQNQKCCLAAIHALSIIADPRSEQMLIDNYNRQFPQAKRETLLAIAKINTGKQTEFFRQAYLHSTSHKTRAVALSCLFNYGEEGRRIFHELAQAGLDDNRFFMQIISSNEQ